MAAAEPMGAADVRFQLCGCENPAASARIHSSKKDEEWVEERKVSSDCTCKGIKEEGEQQTARPIPYLYGQVQKRHFKEAKVVG
jgi:hypothetical protein